MSIIPSGPDLVGVLLDLVRRASACLPAGACTVRVLDSYGRRTAQTLPVRRDGEMAIITLGKVPALWCEVSCP